MNTFQCFSNQARTGCFRGPSGSRITIVHSQLYHITRSLFILFILQTISTHSWNPVHSLSFHFTFTFYLVSKIFYLFISLFIFIIIFFSYNYLSHEPWYLYYFTLFKFHTFILFLFSYWYRNKLIARMSFNHLTPKRINFCPGLYK